MAALAVISLLQGIKNGMMQPVDFLYDSFREALFDHSYTNVQFPFTFWMIYFLGFFPEMAARGIWIVCNLIFTGIIIWVLRKTFFREMDRMDYLILAFTMVAGGPWRTNLSNGQYNLAAIAFLLLAVWLSELDLDIVSGLCLSMCIFKYQVTVPLAVYFFYKRKYKVIGSAFVFLLLSLIGTSLWFGSLYNVTLKQLRLGMGLGNSGDVDLESLFGLGDYTILFFSAAVLLLLVMAYRINWLQKDVLFFSVLLFTTWAFAYQRIYSFFPMIIPLGYAWMQCSEERVENKRFYQIEFLLILILTGCFFFSRTVSESMGLLLERIFYYPVYAMLLTDLFYIQRKGAYVRH